MLATRCKDVVPQWDLLAVYLDPRNVLGADPAALRVGDVFLSKRLGQVFSTL